MKYIILIILFLITLTAFGQNNDYYRLRINEITDDQEVYLLTHDDISYNLDSIQIKKINPNWIKSIEVIKKEVNGVTTSNLTKVYTRLKRRKEKDFLKVIDKHK